MTQAEARQKIIDAANDVHHRNGHDDSPYSMHHLQRCVHIVRQNKAVLAAVLKAAGFKEAHNLRLS